MSKQPVEQPKVRVWRRWQRGLVAAVLVSLLLVILHQPILRGAGTFLNVGQPLNRPVDAVYVLGGGLDTRPFVAAEILRAGMSSQILIPAPMSQSALDDPGIKLEKELTRDLLQKLDVPADTIVELDQAVDSTRGEALALKEFLQAHPSQRVAIVTNDFHTRRSKGIFRAEFSGFNAELVLVSVPTDGFDGTNWWRYEDGVEIYLLEWIKYLTWMIGLS